MKYQLFTTLVLTLTLGLLASASQSETTSYKTIATALKEAKSLNVPTFALVTKAGGSPVEAARESRVAQASKVFVNAEVELTPAIAKQYKLEGDSHILLFTPDGKLADKFGASADPELILGAIHKQTDTARLELLKLAQADLRSRKTAMAGLTRIGPFAEDMVLFLNDKEKSLKDEARNHIASLPPESVMIPLLNAIRSESIAMRTAAHPLLVEATGNTDFPLKIWQGSLKERTVAWEKWSKAVSNQLPLLNRELLEYCEKNYGKQVDNGECAMLVMHPINKREIGMKPKYNSGVTYVWGRQLKFGETPLPGDVVQYEKVKFSNGSASHHTSVVRKVLGWGKYEVLEQNSGGRKTVKEGTLDLSKRIEGSIIFYRPLPR
jgi:hypothetical protein